MSQIKTTDLLLVEDNPADIYLMRQAIADYSLQFRVWSVSNGRDALTFLHKDAPFQDVPSPALILLDLNLPGLKGSEVLTALRRLPAYQSTPVIVVSSSPRVREESHCLQLGASAYVEKSFGFDDYVASIQGILEDWLGADCSPL